MHLHGQAPARIGAQHGFAMAALLVALSVMAVMLTVAMPVWKTAMKREKEAELVWRASQYARAIALFQRKYANAYPPNLDILLNERFLRKKYKDPMVKDGEFQLVYANQGANQPSDGSKPPAAGAGTPLGGSPNLGAARGGIIGVVSKSTERALRMFNGRTKYNEWTFTPQTVLGNRAPGAGGNVPGGNPGNVPGRNVPGANRPGGFGPGNVGRGGQPIGGADRGQITLDPATGAGVPAGQRQQPNPFSRPFQRPPE